MALVSAAKTTVVIVSTAIIHQPPTFDTPWSLALYVYRHRGRGRNWGRSWGSGKRDRMRKGWGIGGEGEETDGIESLDC